MSFDAISSITKAEETAGKLVSEAEAKARALISDAERTGKAEVISAKEKAEHEKAELIKQADDTAAKDDEIFRKETEKSLEALKETAAGKLDIAAGLVVERILED